PMFGPWTHETFAASAAGAGSAASTRAVPDRARGDDPGRGRAGGRRAPPDGEHLAAALPRAGRGRPPRRPAGLAAARPGAADRGRGSAGPGLDRRGDARPAGAAVRALDLARGTRADRAALGEAARA